MTTSNRALTASRWTLLALTVANWVYAAGLLVLGIAMVATPGWLFPALGVPSSADTQGLRLGMLAIVVLGLVAVLPTASILSRLRGMVDSIATESPFVPENVRRLHNIAWALLGIQVIQFIVGLIAEGVSTKAYELDIEAISFAGWMAVLLAFVLAGVFAEGVRMREDLAGTV